MALASLDDVKRILSLTDVDLVRDAKIRACLAAVEAWAEKRIANVSREGQQVEVYYDVYEDARLILPADDATVTKVKVYEYPSSGGVELSPIELGLGHGYDVTDTGELYLRPTLTTTPFEGATAQRRLRTYARVEVYYLGTGVVPRDLTEGIAFLAAGYYSDGPGALHGLVSEKIGDYSYTMQRVSAGDEPSYVKQAKFFLSDYFRKQRVSVT